MRTIDMEKWNRKDHFNFFHAMDYPQYNIGANIDVTLFLDFIKANGLSFYYSMIHAATKVAGSVENFRYRIRKDGIVLHDSLSPSFTDISAGDELFKYVTVDMKDNLFEFVEYAKKQSEAQTVYFGPAEFSGRDDFIYFTCLPWVSFTHMSHTISLNRDDSIPRLSWGKYFSDNGRILLPFSVQVNHALVDGIHVGKFFSGLQNYLNQINNSQGGKNPK